ncbi:MAG: hypothetical protein IJ597_03835 [Synergistaceae bacterium]|nr:hypothetical protein [Synergistaceae bacterium]
MFIIDKKVKNSTYRYLAESYRDENGKPRNKRTYIGKVDDDGVLISSKRKLPAEIKEVKKTTRRILVKNV